MNLAKVNIGDYVEGCRKGLHFEARVEGKRKGALDVVPSSPNITYRSLTARQVVNKLPTPSPASSSAAPPPAPSGESATPPLPETTHGAVELDAGQGALV